MTDQSSHSVASSVFRGALPLIDKVGFEPTCGLRASGTTIGKGTAALAPIASLAIGTHPATVRSGWTDSGVVDGAYLGEFRDPPRSDRDASLGTFPKRRTPTPLSSPRAVDVANLESRLGGSHSQRGMLYQG